MLPRRAAVVEHLVLVAARSAASLHSSARRRSCCSVAGASSGSTSRTRVDQRVDRRLDRRVVGSKPRGRVVGGELRAVADEDHERRVERPCPRRKRERRHAGRLDVPVERGVVRQEGLVVRAVARLRRGEERDDEPGTCASADAAGRLDVLGRRLRLAVTSIRPSRGTSTPTDSMFVDARTRDRVAGSSMRRSIRVEDRAKLVPGTLLVSSTTSSSPSDAHRRLVARDDSDPGGMSSRASVTVRPSSRRLLWYATSVQ